VARGALTFEGASLSLLDDDAGLSNPRAAAPDRVTWNPNSPSTDRARAERVAPRGTPDATSRACTTGYIVPSTSTPHTWIGSATTPRRRRRTVPESSSTEEPAIWNVGTTRSYGVPCSRASATRRHTPRMRRSHRGVGNVLERRLGEPRGTNGQHAAALHNVPGYSRSGSRRTVGFFEASLYGRRPWTGHFAISSACVGSRRAGPGDLATHAPAGQGPTSSTSQIGQWSHHRETRSTGGSTRRRIADMSRRSTVSP
jgi:hypothetical protein